MGFLCIYEDICFQSKLEENFTNLVDFSRLYLDPHK